MPSFYNAGIAVAKRALGVRLDPFSAYNFLVEIDGIIAGGFTEISGLEIETEVERKVFGGENNIEYKFVTRTKCADLTLKHGLTACDFLWEWYNDVTQGKIVRRNGSIYLLNHSGIPTIWWDFVEACPIKWSGPGLNAAGNTIAFETLVLTHHGLSKPQGSRALSAVMTAAQEI
jgi:phage tail-like protein